MLARKKRPWVWQDDFDVIIYSDPPLVPFRRTAKCRKCAHEFPLGVLSATRKQVIRLWSHRFGFHG